MSGRWRMRNWRLRTKLLAVLLLPAIAALVLGAIQLNTNYHGSNTLERNSQQIALGTASSAVVRELQRERDLTVDYVAAHRGIPRAELDKQRARSDVAINAFRAEIGARAGSYPEIAERFAVSERQLGRVVSLRQVTDGSPAYPADAVVRTYTDTIGSLLALNERSVAMISDPGLVRESLTANAVARAQEQESIKRAVLAKSLRTGSFFEGDERELLAAIADRDAAFNDFRKWASTGESQHYSDTVAGPSVDQARNIEETALVRGDGEDPLLGSPLNPEAWFQSSSSTVDLTAQVNQQMRQDAQNEVDSLASAARIQMYLVAAFVVTVLALAFAIAYMVARSLLLPLHTLRRSALHVADEALPSAVDSILHEPSSGTGSRAGVEPIPVYTNEEIGRVARSFDAVHSQALRLAAEQALLRSNVNDLFVNLARRSQTLVQRQLSLIDRLEQDEQDPDQLSSLFELDHLATRMRRNSENLLVLGGTDLARRITKPVPLSEVLGAAVSEVEQYARVGIVETPELALQGRIVNDFVHLLAELLENATVFSNPDTEVSIRTAYRKQELVLEIRDRGVGIDSSEVSEINDRLTRPPEIDVAISRRMGLFVVGQLARRHNIGVELQNNADLEGGVTATVRVSGEYVAQLTPDGPMPMPDVQRSSGGQRDSHTEGVGPQLGLAAAFGHGGSAGRDGEFPAERAAQPSLNGSGPHRSGPTERPVGDPGEGSPFTTGYSAQAFPSSGHGASDVPQYDVDGRQPNTGSGAAFGVSPETGFSKTPGFEKSTGFESTGFKKSTGFNKITESDDSVKAARSRGEEPVQQDVSEAHDGKCGAPSELEGTSDLFHSPFEAEKTTQIPPASGEEAAGEQTPSPDAFSSERVADHEPDDAPTERLPIYEAVLSQWFREDAETMSRPGTRSSLSVDSRSEASPESSGSGSSADRGTAPQSAPGADGPETADDQVGHDEVASQQASASQAGGFAEARETPGQFGPSDSGESLNLGWGAADAGWQAAEALVEQSSQQQQTTSAGLPKRVPKSNLVPGSAASSPRTTAAPRNAATRSPDAVRGRMSNFQSGIRRGRHAKAEQPSTEQSRSIPSRHEEQE